jgi:hypothetical protein
MPKRESQPLENVAQDTPLIRVYGRRFCGSCEHSKPLESGRVVDKRTGRWLCGECLKQERWPLVSKQEIT